MNYKLVILILIIIVIIFYYKSIENFVGGYKTNPDYSIYTYPAGYFDYTNNTNGVNVGVPSQCEVYGDDYDACYSNPECTIWFRPDGSTYCTKKFIHEDI